MLSNVQTNKVYCFLEKFPIVSSMLAICLKLLGQVYKYTGKEYKGCTSERLDHSQSIIVLDSPLCEKLNGFL